MKKILLSICIAAMILSGVCVVAFGNSVDVSAIKLITADKPNINAADRLEMSLDFYILKDSMDYITSKAEDLRVIGLLAEYSEDMKAPELGDGTEIDLIYSGDKTIDSKKYAVYTMNFGVFKVEEYMNMLAIRAFITFEINGVSHTISSDFTAKKNTFSPYSAVYALYTDRSSVLNKEYPYKAPDGSFTSVENLDPLRKILASYLIVDIKSGRVIDKNYGKYYDSLYEITYFDGVLTISMENSAIPDWMLHKLIVNGVERYYEIHNGKIKLVV